MGLLLLSANAELNPRTLFANNEQGLWLDPSDFSTMWQDSGKTTPVTAAGQPVGYIADKSGRGNDASQSTSGARPTLARIPSSGRRNLLTYSEQFDNAAWVKTQSGQVTVTANQATAPDGTSTADLVIPNASSGYHSIRQAPSSTAASVHTHSFYVKPTGYTKVAIREDFSAGQFAAYDCTGSGSVLDKDAAATATITSLSNGWYRISLTPSSTATNMGTAVYILPNTYTSGSILGNWTGDGTSGVYLWGAQLETGSSATNYQKVVATTDVTESGFNDLWHLVFDGSDDSLTTNAVDFSGTDEMTVIAGVRKLSDAIRGTVVELSADWQSNNGTFGIESPEGSPGTGYRFVSKGTASDGQTPTPFTAPTTKVLSLASDISSPSLIARVNSTIVSNSTASQGSGNYGNYAIYIGRRGGTNLPFNGHLYQLIVRGKTTPTGKLLEAERFTARKTGVSF